MSVCGKQWGMCGKCGGECGINPQSPPQPVRFRSKSTVIAHKDDNSVVGFFILLEYMIAFIQ